MASDSPTTKRAYTMRLDGATPEDDSWRERLWITHKKVNDGARFFGDLLLTLRGGVAVPEDSADRAKRRLLALCWFSVESDIPGTKDYRLPKVKRDNFLKCLKAKGISESAHDSWWGDCEPALNAAIREDAVRVERWRMFKELDDAPASQEVEVVLTALLGKEFLKTRGKKKGEDGADNEASASDEKAEGRVIKEARSLYGRWFGKGEKTDFQEIGKAFERLSVFAKKISDSVPAAEELKTLIVEFRKTNKWPELDVKTKGRGKKKTLVAVSEPALAKPGPSKKARTDWEKVLFALRADSSDAESHLPPELQAKKLWEKMAESASDAARDCSEGADGVSRKPWQDKLRVKFEGAVGIKCGDVSGGKTNTEFCRLMLAEAAKRLSQTQSWARRQELDRLESERVVEEKAKRFHPGGGDEKAAEWLDAYLNERGEKSGALDRPVIAKNALDGWKEVVKAWSGCPDAEKRRDAVREAQAAAEKFGDANLFRAIAGDEAECVWRRNGKADESILRDYAAWTRAKEGIRRHKAPSYRHPDAFGHPVFCEFGNSRPDVRYGWQSPKKKKVGEPGALPEVEHQRAIDLLLLDKKGRACETRLRWRSSRLALELGLGDEIKDAQGALSRNTRLGRLASGDFPQDEFNPVKPASVQASKDADLNARLQVERRELASLARLGARAECEACKRLNWFVTMSPELIPCGPWLDFAKTPDAKKIIASKQDSPVWFAPREKRWLGRFDRGWMVRPGLGAFPGIRVLGVDLGHRYGAIGAVWQQVSADEVARVACGKKNIEKSVSLRCKDGRRQLIFRRVGENQWARLDRQFLIRLPGEMDGDSRPPIDWEKSWLKKFLEDLGCAAEQVSSALREDAVGARLEALHLCVQALRRHGDRARIVHYLTAENLPVPGGRLVKVENRLPHAKKAVRLWDRLPAEHAALLEREKELDKNKGREREALLDKIAEVLDAKACRDVSADFKKTWEKEDKLWPQRLRELSAWLVRGRERQNDGKWIRVRGKAAWAKVGGLSLERISTLEQFARLHRAYAHRPTLERLRDDSQETVPHGRAIRDKLELLREDRLKKLANAVAMAAMGLVATQQDKAREVEKGRHAGSRFAPVHAVVIEDLEFYRPEVSRTRRENRGLMSWSARELAKRLGDACELHGLLFLQVRPNYTSRFCSRCGAPGVRGQWIRPSQIARDWYWSRQAAKAQEAKEVERTDLQRLLLKPDGSGKPEIFLPRQGGASFRCSNKDCGVGGGIQADLNAAANIGLRALLDGRWNRAWSYLPTKAGKPTGEGALRGMPESLCGEVLDADAAKDAKQVVNLFRDPSRAASPKESSWKSYKEFFREVESGILSVK